MELFAFIIIMSTIVALVSSIVGVIFGIISIKINNVFVDVCFNIFMVIGAMLFRSVSAASLALILLATFLERIIWR